VVDVNIASQQVSVISGPSTISVNVGIGASGPRGSTIFVGEDAPNLFFTPDASVALGLKSFDLYINTDRTDSGYLYLYQFVDSDGGTTWEPITRIAPTQINVTEELTFTTGSATLDILLTDYFPDPIVLTPEDSQPVTLIDEIKLSITNVTATVENANPVAISVVSKTIVGNTLSIVFKAASLDGTWSLLSGANTVSANVNFVPDNEIS
jgi:hypothetical protein